MTIEEALTQLYESAKKAGYVECRKNLAEKVGRAKYQLEYDQKIIDEHEAICQYMIARVSDKVKKLLSATPEMLEALQIIVGDIERGPRRFTSEEKLTIARNAIKKATE